MINDNFLKLSEQQSLLYDFSNYNIYIKKKGLIYNTKTLAIVFFDSFDISENEIEELLDCGILKKKNENELYNIKKRYDNRRNISDNFNLIIATTLDCQLNCFYCYEKHPKIYMEENVAKNIIDEVKKQAINGKNISVVWYGGEPLLNYEIIRYLTREFLEISKKYNVKYVASMITNGIALSNEISKELSKFNIFELQITLDGLANINNKRRRMVDNPNNINSFEVILNNIKSIYFNNLSNIKIRINVDKSNINDAYKLVNMLAENKLYNVDLTLGMLKEFGCGHKCKFTENMFSMEEFANEYLKFRKIVKDLGFENAYKKMSPQIKINSCTLDAPDSFVIDPNGEVYKCISQVGNVDEALGNIKDGLDYESFKKYTPFDSKKCVECVFLPICMGGCLYKNVYNLKSKDNCEIWKYITNEIIEDMIEEIGV